MLLSKILEGIEYEYVAGFCEREITGVSERSFECGESFIFVAVRGCRYDGNDFINDVRRRSCRVFVSSTKSDIQKGETLIISKNPRKTLAEILKLLNSHLLENIKLIGVTGTKGKTTVAKYIASMLCGARKKCVLIGTLGVSFYGVSLSALETDNTTPDTSFLYKTLALAAAEGIDVAVIEVSSQALSHMRVFGIPFDMCVFTNFSPDHIGEQEHASVEEYFAAKRSLFRDYGARVAVVNARDARSREIAEGVPEIIFAEPSFAVSNGKAGITFGYAGDKFSLPSVGEFNAENAALALAAAQRITGLSPGFFKAALASVRVEGRLEAYKLYGKTVIIDFAHNGISFEKVMREARKITNGRLIALFGSVGGRCRARRRELACVAERLADFSVITSDNPDFEPPGKIAEEIAGFFDCNGKMRIIPDRERAIAYAIGIAKADDTVLLLGKGHERYQLVNGKKIPFSERAIVLSLGGSPIN